jgi:septal ring factor EnvC (AmiA/AmiB activator)
VKAEELHKQMEAAKEDQEAAIKAQFDMAALLSSQREKYEDTINKLCHELGETRVKLQLSEEQRHTHEQQLQQQQQQQQQQQVATAPDVQPATPQLLPPSRDELSADAARQIREKCEAEFLQSLQLLEADWNGTATASDFHLP